MSDLKGPKPVNVHQKLQRCRALLQKAEMKKSGENKFSHYTYFELSDFLPKINELMDEYGLTAIFHFTMDEATLEIINTEKIDEVITFTTPVTVAELKGCYGIQNIGATQTYARRYLYVMAFEIAESDALDSTEADEETLFKAKPIDPIKVGTVKEMLKKTNADEKAFLKYYNLKQVEDIPNGAFTKIMKTLQDKLEKMEKDKPVDLGI